MNPDETDARLAAVFDAMDGNPVDLDADGVYLAGMLDQLGRFFAGEVFRRPRWREQWFGGDFWLRVDHRGFTVRGVDQGPAGEDLRPGGYL
jgi:hypothetical protein